MIYFLPDQIDSMVCVNKIKAENMKVFLRDGSTQDFKNPFTAQEPFRIYPNTGN